MLNSGFKLITCVIYYADLIVHKSEHLKQFASRSVEIENHSNELLSVILYIPSSTSLFLIAYLGTFLFRKY